MSSALPRLRMDLDFMPSPSAQHPGLLIRDPMKFSDDILVIPPPLVELLGFFDGESDAQDVRMQLVRATGDLQAGMVLDQLLEALDRSGFLDSERGRAMAEEKRAAFASGRARVASHAGEGGYPEDPRDLRAVFDGYFAVPQRIEAERPVRAIAAPHVSPFGGWQCYRDAYAAARQAVGESAADKTFVILGTSHYGEPDRFGLTRKSFETPWGQTRAAAGLVDKLVEGAPGSVILEDYCHAVEHSIEFQVVFLQYLFGPDMKVLPILCGSFSETILSGAGKPEDDDGVARFLDCLAEINQTEDNLFYVLGVDMAHVGRRYGDPWGARAGMTDVADRDRDRIRQMELGSAGDFWMRIQENHDDLKWCGSAPIYTYLKTQPGIRGQLIEYEQWNIDDASVVSFAAMQFS
jgi:AmmeMemoRadiSam system protein B